MELQPQGWVPPPIPDTLSPEARAFLAQARIALVGASANDDHFSRTLLHALQSQSYDVVPVNKRTDYVDGLTAYPTVSAIPEPVDAAYIAVHATGTEAIVQDCIDANVGYIWFHHGAGDGAVDPAAVRMAQNADLVVVPGGCVLMCLKETGWVHQVHRGLAALTGDLP